MREVKDGDLKSAKNFSFFNFEGIKSMKLARFEASKQVGQDTRLDHKNLHRYKATCKIK